jgi:hypothetical protein
MGSGGCPSGMLPTLITGGAFEPLAEPPAAKPRCRQRRLRQRTRISRRPPSTVQRIRQSPGRPTGHRASWHGGRKSSAASRRNLHVLRRPAGQPSTQRCWTEPTLISQEHGHDLTAPRKRATPPGPPPRNARFCLLTELRGLAAAQAKVAVAARPSADRNAALDRSRWP